MRTLDDTWIVLEFTMSWLLKKRSGIDFKVCKVKRIKKVHHDCVKPAGF